MGPEAIGWLVVGADVTIDDRNEFDVMVGDSSNFTRPGGLDAESGDVNVALLVSIA